MNELKVFSGNTHPSLAQAIVQYLGIPLGMAEVFEFSNENIFVRIKENIRSQDVFIVQPLSSPVNKGLMELLIMVDACKRASAGRITAVIPYYGYGRTDKKDEPRIPITARLVADLLTTAGVNRMLTVDLHAPQIQGFFNIPVDELTAMFILSRYFKDKNWDDLVVVATDVGISKKARNFAARLNTPLAIIEKRREGNRTESLRVIGEVKGMRTLLFDDEIDTGESMIQATTTLLEAGAWEVYSSCTHAVFSGDCPYKLFHSPIKEVVVTDTVPIPQEKKIPRLTVLSLAPLLGEAIRRIHTGQSVGALFYEEADIYATSYLL